MKLRSACKKLHQAGCTNEYIAVSSFAKILLQEALAETERVSVHGAGLVWVQAPVMPSCCVDGERYTSWNDAENAKRMLGEGWRLPTEEELKALFAEKPTCEVFAKKGYAEIVDRRGTKEAISQGVGFTARLWTAQSDSRDFAIEGMVTEDKLTFHPTPKASPLAMWLVHSVVSQKPSAPISEEAC